MLKSAVAALQRSYQALPVAARGAATAAATLPLCFPTVCIWGANTGVGKTLFSAGLAAACSRAGLAALYLKPVQTGFPQHSDARLVALLQGCREERSPHVAALLPALPPSEVPHGAEGNAARCRTMFAWQAAVSPHLAVELEGRAVPDEDIVAGIAGELAALASGPAASRALAIVETAGGVASPGPSGTLQCDLLRPLRLPGILVGDGRLGGISATIAAHESLVARGFDVPVVAVMDGGLGNAAALSRHFGGSAQVLSFPECHPAAAGPAAVDPGMQSVDTLENGSSGGIDSNLAEWLAATQGHCDRLLALVTRHHEQRVAALESAADEARGVLWWPFTQHGSLDNSEAAAVTVIDSRSGEHLAVFRPEGGGAVGKGPAVQLQYDACASWWTQGVNQEAQPALGRAVGRAAARYGHIIFPQNVHQPALHLAQALLDGVGAGWASRVFYTDNGSTAVEVALKMAFRKFMVDHRVLEEGGPQLEVLGLQQAYHGDTLGAMDAVAPSVFNGRLQTPWYAGRGLFLDPPTAAMHAGGAWEVRLPAALQAALQSTPAEAEAQARLEDADAVFSSARGGGALAAAYRSHVEAAMDWHAAQRSGVALGAAIVEPALQGAGGMRLVDPLFQRAVVEASRTRGIPVIYDEVFTGFWRLGAPSAAALLGMQPDIACYAKLLTGGVAPLAATLATDAVFRAFSGDSKAHALLHGHSYTAHPIGCSAALQALSSYTDLRLNPNVCTPAAAGRCRRGCAAPCGSMLPMWDPAAVRRLASHRGVSRVLPLGTVLALELESTVAGYASEGAAAVVQRLRARGVYARPLGNVVYLMVTPMTARGQCDELLGALEAALSE